MNSDGKSTTTTSTAVSRRPNSRNSAKSANPNGVTVLSSAPPVITAAVDIRSSATLTSPSVQIASSAAATVAKPHGKDIVTSEFSAKQVNNNIMLFKDLTLGPHVSELRFRLVHFWEARKALTKVLIGVEMLLIDEEGTVAKGFIPAGRVDKYVPLMKAVCVYRLFKFFGAENKDMYRVADHSVAVCLSWDSVLSPLENSTVVFPEDHFRFHGHAEFEEKSDQRGDLYDCIGHMRVVNGQPLIDRPILDEEEIARTRHVSVHVQTHDGPTMKLYLWDNAATVFCQKFKSSENTPKVLLVTTLNPKTIGGTLAISSMSSSRVFMDQDVQQTMYYLAWLSSNLAVANMINGEVVTKRETLNINELYAYIKQENAKVAWFDCVATIDDVVKSSTWYYTGCGICKTKVTKGPTTLMCRKCGKAEIIGVAQYITKIYVSDETEKAVFVVLGDAGHELTGKRASQFVESFFENEGADAEHVVLVPQGLLDTIGQKRKFCIKISEHNLAGKTMSLTVTKVHAEEAEDGAENQPPMEEAEDVAGPAAPMEEAGDGGVKRASDGGESEENKRSKSG